MAGARAGGAAPHDAPPDRRLIGVEHLRIGTDMGGLPSTTIPDYPAFAAVPAALLAHGFSEGDLRAVLGGTFTRVFAAAAAV